MNPIELQLPYTHTESELIAAFAKTARISNDRAGQYAIIRKSIDARKKNDIRILYQIVEKSVCPELKGIAALVQSGAPQTAASYLDDARARSRMIVVGAGPAGLFAALYLAMVGYRPVLIERGQPVEQRQLDVARFWNGGTLDPESNVQFGEGGAGTFSDGKLATGIRDPRCRSVLEELVLLGAPSEILYLAKPHVGTDRLRAIVRAMRQKIEHSGGEIRFGTKLTGLIVKIDTHSQSSQLKGVIVERQNATDGKLDAQSEELPVDALLLAIGHSARDTFKMLQTSDVPLMQKPFSVGLRVEHRQALIDRSQYGAAAGHPNLPPAEYHLSSQLSDGRALYTFCMCPGGQVIAAASADGELVTNGMSHFARNGENANSALLVPVGPGDFSSDDPLAGMHFQQKIEHQAFRVGGSKNRAPVQTVGDFLMSSPGGEGLSITNPTYSNGVTFADMTDILPPFVTRCLREGLPLLSRKLHGFADPGSILTGVETRSSSPVRILRDETGQSKLLGLFPCGEGAGYAGGIISAAVDGLRCAQAVVTVLAAGKAGTQS